MPTVPMLTDITVTSELLGRGNFCAVFKATQHGVSVAAKSFTLAIATNPADHVARLLSTAIADVIELCHPNLVQISGIFQAQFSQPTIVSEFMGLGSLQHRVLSEDAAPLSFRDTVDINLGVLRGLRFLHEQQHPVIHARLTDHNVLLSADGQVKLSDYGLSSFISANFHEYRYSGDIVAFLPPEVLSKGHMPSVKADVFATGVLLLECTLSTPPARGESLDQQTAARRRTADLHRAQRSEMASSGLPSTIRQCFEIQPTRRPACAQLESDLQALCASTEYMWSEARLLQTTSAPAASRYSTPRANAPLAVFPTSDTPSGNVWQEFESLSSNSTALGSDLTELQALTSHSQVEESTVRLQNVGPGVEERSSLFSVEPTPDWSSGRGVSPFNSSNQALQDQSHTTGAEQLAAPSRDQNGSSSNIGGTSMFSAEMPQSNGTPPATDADFLHGEDEELSFETNELYQSSAAMHEEIQGNGDDSMFRAQAPPHPGSDESDGEYDHLGPDADGDGQLSGDDGGEFAFVANTIYSSQESIDQPLDTPEETAAPIAQAVAAQPRPDSYSLVTSNRPVESTAAGYKAVPSNQPLTVSNSSDYSSVPSNMPASVWESQADASFSAAGEDSTNVSAFEHHELAASNTAAGYLSVPSNQLVERTAASYTSVPSNKAFVTAEASAGIESASSVRTSQLADRPATSHSDAGPNYQSDASAEPSLDIDNTTSVPRNQVPTRSPTGYTNVVPQSKRLGSSEGPSTDVNDAAQVPRGVLADRSAASYTDVPSNRPLAPAESSIDGSSAAINSREPANTTASPGFYTMVGNQSLETPNQTQAVNNQMDNMGEYILAQRPAAVVIHNRTELEGATDGNRSPKPRTSRLASLKPIKKPRKSAKKQSKAAEEASFAPEGFWDTRAIPLDSEPPVSAAAAAPLSPAAVASPSPQTTPRAKATSPKLPDSPTLQRLFDANHAQRQQNQENDYIADPSMKAILEKTGISPTSKQPGQHTSSTSDQTDTSRSDLEASWMDDLPIGGPSALHSGTLPARRAGAQAASPARHTSPAVPAQPQQASKATAGSSPGLARARSSTEEFEFVSPPIPPRGTLRSQQSLDQPDGTGSRRATFSGECLPPARTLSLRRPARERHSAALPQDSSGRRESDPVASRVPSSGFATLASSKPRRTPLRVDMVDSDGQSWQRSATMAGPVRHSSRPGARSGMPVSWDRPQSFSGPTSSRQLSSQDVITQSSLYHGKISRQEAEDLLWNKSVGTFLLRDGSSHGGAYSISLRVPDRCKHFRVVLNETRKYMVPGWPTKHDTMSGLIAYHMKHPLSEGDVDTLSLPCRRER